MRIELLSYRLRVVASALNPNIQKPFSPQTMKKYLRIALKQTILILTTMATLMTGCVDQNAQAYWQARQAAIASMPPGQRAQAQVELMRDQRQEQLAAQQRISDAFNEASQQINADIQ